MSKHLCHTFHFFLNWSGLIAIVSTAVDVFVQLLICFICVTIGYDVRLRKLKITLDMTTGVPKVIFLCVRERVRESFINIEIEVEDSVES